MYKFYVQYYGIIVLSVSYTHLDVYKRQDPNIILLSDILNFFKDHCL